MTERKPPWRVVFFGTPDFAVPTLEALWGLRPIFELVAVVTAPDKPAGREQEIILSPAKLWALDHRTLVLQPESLTDPGFLETVATLQPSVGVLAAYGKILPENLINCFPKGILNVHPSLLPRWRGSSPIQAAIAAGDRETGVTIHLLSPQIDAGPILAQESYPLRGDETVEGLTAFLAQRGAELLSRTLFAWMREEITPRPQEERFATIAPAIAREEGRLNWSQSQEMILRLLRAYGRWPGAFTFLPDGKRLKILEAAASSYEGKEDLPGTIREDKSGAPIVRTADGWLRLNRVQPEGKTPMDGIAFLNGHRDLIGKKLS
jgi:methionyl-tRNA formyltransferase